MVIERLLKHVFARVGDAACRDFRPEWRQRVLYTAPVDKVLKKYEDVLERIFYENDVKSYWTLDTFEDTLALANFYEDSFTRHEGNLSFYFGKMAVVDTEKSAEKYQHLDWLGYLESLVHVARFKGFLESRLAELECEDVLDYALRCARRTSVDGCWEVPT